MAKQTVMKKRVVPTPQNLSEAADFVRQIGEAQREIDQANNEMNAKLEATKQPFMEQVGQHQQQLADLMEGLYAFAQANRSELTKGGTKTVSLPTGTFRWHMTPKSVTIKGADDVLARLKDLKLDRFIRTKEEINREAMLGEESVAAAVDGVSFVQREEFRVKPSQAHAEITATPGKQALKMSVSSDSPKKPAKKKTA